MITYPSCSPSLTDRQREKEKQAEGKGERAKMELNVQLETRLSYLLAEGRRCWEKGGEEKTPDTFSTF